MHTKRVSGPYPLSCITCRERRKKCDRTHPTCNRCKIGGFMCLGYASRDNHDVNGSNPPPQAHPNLSLVSSSAPPSDQRYDDPPFQITTFTHQPTLQTRSQRLESQPVQLPFHYVSSPTLSSLSSPHPVIDTSLKGHARRPPDDTGICTTSHFAHNYQEGEPESNQDNIDASRDRGTSRDHLGFSVWNMPVLEDGSIYWVDETSSGYEFYRNPDTSVVATEFITSRYMLAYSLMAMELAAHQECFVQSCVLTNVTISQGACWSLFIGAKIYQAVMSGYDSKLVKPYIQYLDQLDQQISVTNRNGMITREISGWLMAALELGELRFLIDPKLAYRTLRLAVPLFVRLARTEPSLWRSQNSRLSLHGVILSSRAGLARFANMDVLGSFILGLPQLISWDPAFMPELAQLSWDEWTPGFPPDFLLVLCRVNAWRNADSHNRDPNEWVEYERNILGWRPRHIHRSDASDSWKAVGRLAVQEAYRHMTLIYLYMGMGSLRSGDYRVQESCSQISRLCSLINSNSDLAVHFFFPAIVAGVCARNEKHRSALWHCVAKAESCKSFLFKELGFTQVLDHLWLGSASSGVEVTWEDYLVSCQVVVKMQW